MSKWWKDFAEFINNGNSKNIMHMLKKIPAKSIPKTCDREGNTLLHYVAKTNNTNIISYLISSGCDINIKNNIGDPPIIEAITKNSTEVIKLLVDKEVILSNTYYENECGLLHKSAKYGYYDTFDILLKAGCDMKEDINGLTVLHYAMLSKSDENHNSRNKLIKTIIKLGVDVNAITESKSTPLHFASACDTKILRLLLNAGAQLESKDANGRTPLMLASAHGNFHITKHLLKVGARINQTDNNGMTSLCHAIHNLHPEIVKLLIDNGACVNAINTETTSPLWRCLNRCCLSDESTKLFNKLVDEVIERDFPNKIQAQVQCLKLLLEYGADPNVKSTYFPNPITPIYSAIFVNHSKIVDLLLQYNATFDYEHKYGSTFINRFNSQKSKSAYLLLRHTAKYKAQNQNDGPLNFKLENLKKSQQSYYAQCRDELERMKISYIYGSITFFNILTDFNIEKYVRGDKKSVKSAFEYKRLKKCFPIYFDILNEKIVEELERRKIIEISSKNLSDGLRIGENYVNIIFSNVFKYLNKRDLRMLEQL